MEHSVGTHRPAGLREKPSRVAGVVTIRRQMRRRPRFGEDIGNGELVDAVKDRVVDTLPIDRFGDRAPHAHVGKLRRLMFIPKCAPSSAISRSLDAKPLRCPRRPKLR